MNINDQWVGELSVFYLQPIRALPQKSKITVVFMKERNCWANSGELRTLFCQLLILKFYISLAFEIQTLLSKKVQGKWVKC